jgi:hypothetical protein
MKLIHKVADCDLCPRRGQDPPLPAEFDAPTIWRSWADMCAFDMSAYGIATDAAYRLTRDADDPRLESTQVSGATS